MCYSTVPPDEELGDQLDIYIIDFKELRMKYFGFIKEHGNDKHSVSIKELINDVNTESPYRLEVINYLKLGELCVAWMGCVENVLDPAFDTDEYDDDDFIAYAAIDTDGKWYWPEYIVAYLEKYPTMKIDSEFVNYVLKNKDIPIKLSEEELLKLEKQFTGEGDFKILGG